MNPLIRTSTPIVAALLAASFALSPAAAQEEAAVDETEVEEETREEEATEDVATPARFRIILNGAFWLGGNPSFGETRRLEEYAEETTIRARYETGSAFGPEIAAQVRLYRDFGVRVAYSFASRDETGTVDVSRPHPLYFDRPREASTELTGLSYSEKAFHLDAAFARSAGQLDWSVFAGVTFFSVEADLLGELTYTDVYPYNELSIASAPSVTADSSPVGFNLGAGLDYRFGSSRRFGVGVQLLYSSGSVELQATAPEAETISFDAGGLQAAAGVRVYF